MTLPGKIFRLYVNNELVAIANEYLNKGRYYQNTMMVTPVERSLNRYKNPRNSKSISCGY